MHDPTACGYAENLGRWNSIALKLQSSTGWKTPTEKPDPSRRRFGLGPTPLTSKKKPVRETTTEANPLICRMLEREVNTTLTTWRTSHDSKAEDVLSKTPY